MTFIFHQINNYMESPTSSDLVVALSALAVGFFIIETHKVEIEPLTKHSTKITTPINSSGPIAQNVNDSEPFKDTIYVVSERGVEIKNSSELPKAKLIKSEEPIKEKITRPKIEVNVPDLQLYHEYFGSEKQIESFVRYIKTQSNDLDTKAGNIDNYFVIQVMLNRLRKNNCDWQTYYSDNAINNSQTIRKMKAGKKVPNNSIDGNYKAIRSRLFEVLGGELPDSLTVPENLYYFHSHKTWKFAKGIWNKKNYYTTHKHHFFTGI